MAPRRTMSLDNITNEEYEKMEPKTKRQLAAEMYMNGSSQKYIAEQLGLKTGTVGSWLSRDGIKKGEYAVENYKKQFNSTEEQKLYDAVKKAGLNPDEALKVIKNLTEMNPKKYKAPKIDFSGDYVKFGYFTDAHMGHKHYRRDVFRTMAEYFKKEKVDFIVNSGDTIEGMSNRDGHIFELDYIGVSAQMKLFENEMKLLGDIPVYSIEAQDSHGGWAHNKANQGLDIGEELSRRAANYKFIGYDEQDIILDNGLKIRLRHPGGGTAYAISYKMQKYVESIGGGNKPHIIFQGHFHKYNKMFYRNINCIDAGALQNQSPFMKKKGTPSHVGFGMVEVRMKNGSVAELKETWFPFYD